MTKSDQIKSQTLLMVSADPKDCAGIASMLADAGYGGESVATTAGLKSKLKEASFMAVIIDLDSVALDNATIKKLATEFPEPPFLCVSKERFHPELRESILSHIYACLTKPVDPDELVYWLKCIQQDDRKPTFG